MHEIDTSDFLTLIERSIKHSSNLFKVLPKWLAMKQIWWKSSTREAESRHLYTRAIDLSDLLDWILLAEHKPTCEHMSSGFTCTTRSNSFRSKEWKCKREKYQKPKTMFNLKPTPDTKRSHIISPYWETTSLHSTLRTPSAPIAWLISATTGWN